VRYDAKVQAAVRSFQISQGLLPDGGAGPQTLLRLNALALAEQPRLSDSPAR
jgi:general secretion pathway protein A